MVKFSQEGEDESPVVGVQGDFAKKAQMSMSSTGFDANERSGMNGTRLNETNFNDREDTSRDVP